MSQKNQNRILCFGDSLTAGTSPPHFDTFPYAPHLDHALQQQFTNIDVVVRHIGLPGWTSKDMVNEQLSERVGLRHAIQRVQGPPLSLVILLAGTNDMAYESNAQVTVESILKLHSICHEEKVPHTIAIGVPPSAYQTMNADAAALNLAINEGLMEYCAQNPKSMTFVPFPFQYEHNGANWSTDGLHFSQEGYKLLGESLTPTVGQVLKSIS